MATTVRYADFNLTTGANDGTSKTDAWQSWAAVRGGVAANHEVRFNPKSGGGSFSEASNQTWTTSGGPSTPIVLRGWDFTSDVPALHSTDFVTARISFRAAHLHIYDMEFITTSNGNAPLNVTSTAALGSGSQGYLCGFYRCRAINDNNSGSNDNSALKVEATAGDDLGAVFVSCYFENARAAATARCVKAQHNAAFVGCFINATGGSDGIYADGCRIVVNQCVIVGSGGSNSGLVAGVNSAGYSSCTVMNSTFYDFNTGIEYTDVPDATANDGVIPFLTCNNIFYNMGAYGIDAPTGMNDACFHVNNAFGAITTRFYNPVPGVTSSPINQISLSADPFTDAANDDFTLNNNAGGGAACRAAGVGPQTTWGTELGFLDVGALQVEAALSAGPKPQTPAIRILHQFSSGDKIRIRAQKTDGAATVATLADGTSLSLSQ